MRKTIGKSLAGRNLKVKMHDPGQRTGPGTLQGVSLKYNKKARRKVMKNARNNQSSSGTARLSAKV